MLGARTAGLRKTDARDRNFKCISAHHFFYHTQNNKMNREFDIFTWKKTPKQHMVNDGHIFCEWTQTGHASKNINIHTH